MQNSKFNTSIYQLDAETLYLLRIRAIMEIDEYASNRVYHSEDELKSFLSTITESKSYFTQLKECIGTKNGKVKRRPLKITTVWNAVRDILNHHLSAGRVAKNMKAIEKVTSLLGFSSAEELKCAAITKGYEFIGSGLVSVEDQDAIANAFGYENWLDMNNIPNVSYRTSETALQSAFGRYKNGSALSRPTLNVISQFICDMNWDEYNNPKVRQQVKEDILRFVVKAPKVKAYEYLSSLGLLHEGDEIIIKHNDGTVSTFYFNQNKLQSTFNLCA